jgi:putative membrane protein insertion efficiency factor
MSFILKLIKIYQRTLSPDHSFWAKQRYPNGYCRFYPSCSEYSRQALLKYGFLKGIGKTIWRILRCNPFSNGGLDPALQMGIKEGRG